MEDLFMRPNFKPGFRMPLVPLFALIALFAPLVNAYAQDPFAVRILALEGRVEVRRPTAGQSALNRLALLVSIAVKIQDQLLPGDTIITGRNGRVVLGLTDGSQVVIAPQTTLEIDDLSRSPRHLLNLIKGKARLQIEKLGGKPNPYRVNTPTTVIAVRGTIFDVLVDGDETEVYLHEGEVEVTNRQLPDQPLLLLAGRQTRVRGTAPPRLPRIFGPGRNDRAFRFKSRQVGSAAPASRSGGSPSSRTPQRDGGADRTPRRSDPRAPRIEDGPARRDGAGGRIPSSPSPGAPRPGPGGRRP
jgi:hypothetical protein